MAGIALNRSRQVPAEDTPAFGGIAERFRRAGDLDRAIQLCRDGLKKFPDHLSARVTLGWSLLDQGKYDEARVELEQALKRAPDNLAAIRGLAELHDRAEHTMMLPMDGPGQWPPDAAAIDSLPTEPADEGVSFDFSLRTAAQPAAPVVEEVVARAEPVVPVVAPVEPVEEEPAAKPDPAPARRKVKAGKRVAARAARAEAERAAEPTSASEPVASAEPTASVGPAVAFEPVVAAPLVDPVREPVAARQPAVSAPAARSAPAVPAAPPAPEPEIILTNSAGQPLSSASAATRPAATSPAPSARTAAAPAPAAATPAAPVVPPPVASAPVAPAFAPAASAPVVTGAPVVTAAPVAPAKPAAPPPAKAAPVAQAAAPALAPAAATELIAPVEIETPASAVARAMESVITPERAVVQVSPPMARSGADDPSAPSLVEQMLTTPVIEPPSVEPVAEVSDEAALDEAMASLADFAPLNIDTRAPAPAASEPPAVDLDFTSDLSLEAAMRDLVPAGTDPVALPVVLDETSAAELNLDQLVEQLAAVDDVVISASAGAPASEIGGGGAADLASTVAPPQDADVAALIAEAAALEQAAEVIEVLTPAAPIIDLQPEPEDDPARPALVLTNPTLEDFPDLAAVANEAEAAPLVSGNVEVNELPLLTAFVDETIEVDAAAVGAELVSDVPARPRLELTHPTDADFSEPDDLGDVDDDDDTESVADAAGDSPELPVLTYLNPVPDEPEVVEPVSVVVPVRSARIPLERFLRQVQARRARLMSESVA